MEWPPVPPPPPVALEEFTVDAASEGSAAAAAAAFNSMGMVVVRGLVPASVAQRAYTQATGSLEQLLATIDKRGVELGVGTKAGWSEVVRRTPKRYEMNYEMRDGVFAEESVAANPWLAELIPRIMAGTPPASVAADAAPVLPPSGAAAPAVKPTSAAPPLAPPTCARQSLLISMPGAGGQQWHVDGGHLSPARHQRAHAVNVFVALSDIALNMGPTEMRPASQFLTRKLTKMMLLAKARKQLHAPITPTMRAGDAVIFDYRTLHRGTANSSERPRAMLELVYWRAGWSDLLNFPKRSVFDA